MTESTDRELFLFNRHFIKTFRENNAWLLFVLVTITNYKMLAKYNGKSIASRLSVPAFHEA